MPKINQSAAEKSADTGAEVALTANAIPEATKHTSFPTMVASVNRKINTGNFESVDVHCSITLPIDALPQEMSWDDFRQAVADAAKLGFDLCSQETGERYELVKKSQNAKRG